VHVRLLDFDVVKVHNRIERDHTIVRGLADHLPVHLAGWRHIDDEIAHDPGRAGKSMPRRQRAPASVADLGLAQRRQVLRTRVDVVFGKIAFHDEHLTSTAQRPASTDGVHIDSERACGLQQRGTDCKAPALARRREDDECVGHGELRPG
jgi:hypothetical protein